MDREAKKELLRIRYRLQITEWRKLNPDGSRGELDRALTMARRWEGKHDEEWLLKNLPPRRPHLGRRKSLRPSADRRRILDRQLAEKIPIARLTILSAPGAPARVSEYRLLAVLGYPNGLGATLPDMPATREALARNAESLQDCAIRRLSWLSKQAPPRGTTRWNLSSLLSRAGIHREWIVQYPQVGKAVAEAKRELGIRDSRFESNQYLSRWQAS